MTTEAQPAPILGLMLAGGRSRRMGQDKASLIWDGQPMWRRQLELLRACGLTAAVSVRPGQELPGFLEGECELIPDCHEDAGPLAGFLSAWARYPEHALLAVACDLPLLDANTIGHLLERRDAACFATAYTSANDGLPEPLCALYEPAAQAIMQRALDNDRRCPRKILIEGGASVRLLALPRPMALENANTPEELERLRALEKEALA